MGAFGAFGTGMGSTDIGVAYATGRTWFRVPETINVNLVGELPEGVFAKDISLEIVRQLGVDGANYRAIEYTGPVIENFSMSERMTFSNMAIEMGAKALRVDDIRHGNELDRDALLLEIEEGVGIVRMVAVNHQHLVAGP